MGIVYDAYDEKIDRRVALKVLLGELARAEFRAPVVQESRAAAALDHPSILPVFDAGRAGRHALHRLAPRRRRRPAASSSISDGHDRPSSGALAIAGQIAAALDYSHAGIVHRDVKPGNVLLVDGDGRRRRPRLPHRLRHHDDAVARHAPDRDRTSSSARPSYVSPSSSASAAVDGRATSTRSRASVSRCLAGCSPFERPRAVDVMHARPARGAAQPPSAARGACRRAIGAAIAAGRCAIGPVARFEPASRSSRRRRRGCRRARGQALAAAPPPAAARHRASASAPARSSPPVALVALVAAVERSRPRSSAASERPADRRRRRRRSDRRHAGEPTRRRRPDRRAAGPADRAEPTQGYAVELPAELGRQPRRRSGRDAAGGAACRPLHPIRGRSAFVLVDALTGYESDGRETIATSSTARTRATQAQARATGPPCAATTCSTARARTSCAYRIDGQDGDEIRRVDVFVKRGSRSFAVSTSAVAPYERTRANSHDSAARSIEVDPANASTSAAATAVHRLRLLRRRPLPPRRAPRRPCPARYDGLRHRSASRHGRRGRRQRPPHVRQGSTQRHGRTTGFQCARRCPPRSPQAARRTSRSSSGRLPRRRDLAGRAAGRARDPGHVAAHDRDPRARQRPRARRGSQLRQLVRYARCASVSSSISIAERRELQARDLAVDLAGDRQHARAAATRRAARGARRTAPGWRTTCP